MPLPRFPNLANSKNTIELFYPIQAQKSRSILETEKDPRYSTKRRGSETSPAGGRFDANIERFGNLNSGRRMTSNV